MIAEDSSIKAGYQYSAFGSVTATFGEEAESNPWRFSTKPVEVDTGWSYYGFRYYDAENGRWASRDPIEERGGVNLYGFVGNAGVGNFDVLGFSSEKVTDDAGVKCSKCEVGTATIYLHLYNISSGKGKLLDQLKRIYSSRTHDHTPTLPEIAKWAQNPQVLNILADAYLKGALSPGHVFLRTTDWRPVDETGGQELSHSIGFGTTGGLLGENPGKVFWPDPSPPDYKLEFAACPKTLEKIIDEAKRIRTNPPNYHVAPGLTAMLPVAPAGSGKFLSNCQEFVLSLLDAGGIKYGFKTGIGGILEPADFYDTGQFSYPQGEHWDDN